MPSILKERTARSPGVMTFTHNEAVRGLPANSERVKKFLSDSRCDNSWIFGVHIQGDCSHYYEWPLEPWQSFIMWPEPGANFLANVPDEMKIGINCINFMPTIPRRPAGMNRNVDICVISRPSSIKRIHETLLMLRGLMDTVPGFSATLISPDPRHIEFGRDCYERQEIDRSLFELPTRIFSSEEGKRISFVCSSRDAFGRFPIAVPLLNDMLQRSRFLLLPSHKEGTPRVIAEALLAGTPCILSESLASGIKPYLSPSDTLYVSDDIETSVRQIGDALKDYGRFHVDVGHIEATFSAAAHIPVLEERISTFIAATGAPIEGRWFLNDLHLRLPCHGFRHETQFMNREGLFFDWLDRIDAISGRAAGDFDPYDEDAIFGTEPLNDSPLAAASTRSATPSRSPLQSLRGGLQRLFSAGGG